MLRCAKFVHSKIMHGMRRHILGVGLAALLWAPTPAKAQASTDLAPGSRVEWVVEKLVGFGLIDDRVIGVRPWSRKETLRLLDQARANLPRLSAADREAENRRTDWWVVLRRPDGELDAWEKVEDLPDELYLRAVSTLSVFGQDGREFSLGIGVERVSDSLFRLGATRYDGIVELKGRLLIGGHE